MKIKCLILTALILAVASVGFAQSKTKAGYLGEWFSEHGDEIAVSATKIVLRHAAVTQNYKFRDVTGAGGKTIYYLQMIGNSDKDMLFSKFCSLSIEKDIASPFSGGNGKNVDVLTITSYKTRADMKAGKNALSTDKWIRGR